MYNSLLGHYRRRPVGTCIRPSTRIRPSATFGIRSPVTTRIWLVSFTEMSSSFVLVCRLCVFRCHYCSAVAFSFFQTVVHLVTSTGSAAATSPSLWTAPCSGEGAYTCVSMTSSFDPIALLL
jgi:hypothetical protein